MYKLVAFAELAVVSRLQLSKYRSPGDVLKRTVGRANTQLALPFEIRVTAEETLVWSTRYPTGRRGMPTRGFGSVQRFSRIPAICERQPPRAARTAKILLPETGLIYLCHFLGESQNDIIEIPTQILGCDQGSLGPR